MTTLELIQNVQLKVDSKNGNQTRYYQKEHILWALNEAQGRLIDMYVKENSDGYFEVDEVGQEIVAPFIVEKETLLVTGGKAQKPNELRYILNANANEKNASRNVKFLKSSYAKNIMNLPFFASCNSFINAEQIGNTIKVYPYIEPVESIDLLYIENPSLIDDSNTTKLRTSFHSTLCDIASLILVNPTEVDKVLLSRKENKLIIN